MGNPEELKENQLNLKDYLPEDKRKELEEILAYWEKIKERWGKKKKEFWKNHTREDFLKLLWYERKPSAEEEKILWKMSGIEREKFIEEYLHDDILYSTEITWKEEKKGEKIHFYDERKKWWIELNKYDTLLFLWDEIRTEYVEALLKMKLKEWITLDLGSNNIWAEWAKAIAEKMELKEWVELNLSQNNIWVWWAEAIAKNLKLKEWVALNLRSNNIWAEWAKAIAENMKLKEWVSLTLSKNDIWAKWAKAIAENMKLKEWVYLDLSFNQIWDSWAEAIAENMKLKEWVTLNLSSNGISEAMKKKLKAREKSYQDKWIKCKVIV